MSFETLKKKIIDVLTRNHVEFAAIFGSAARGEARSDSDIDILVRFNKDISLLDHIGIAQELEDELHKKVDLITEKGLREFAVPSVKKDLIILYGQLQRPDLLQ